jgi:hypothetical protein
MGPGSFAPPAHNGGYATAARTCQFLTDCGMKKRWDPTGSPFRFGAVFDDR